MTVFCFRLTQATKFKQTLFYPGSSVYKIKQNKKRI